MYYYHLLKRKFDLHELSHQVADRNPQLATIGLSESRCSKQEPMLPLKDDGATKALMR